ncbi:hypothetical protein CEV31_2774 [Brucella thiophenivorans]|uniref:Uncharacterized protein n=1 Tax=Brucella thiophenivorans TaxID=571255 RepID=A0A256FLB1_9HYPH|nr:hypothetical protein CEV31_2774 [Brucella thiophenivorans]
MMPFSLRHGRITQHPARRQSFSHFFDLTNQPCDFDFSLGID